MAYCAYLCGHNAKESLREIVKDAIADDFVHNLTLMGGNNKIKFYGSRLATAMEGIAQNLLIF